MSILSDIEIKQLSTIPNFVVEKLIPSLQSPSNDIYISPYQVTEYSYSDEETIKRNMKQPHQDTGIINYRPLTDEEKNKYPVMISPFMENQVRKTDDGNKVISYGVSSYGYDIRAGFKYKVFTNVNSAVVDPKDLDPKSFINVELDKVGDYIIIPPNSFILTHSLEHLNMPRNVTGVVLGKSTYARAGITTLCTPLECGWSGYVTLEFQNTSSLPCKFYAGEGCCQVLFFEGNRICQTSYADRDGKYMNQPADVVLPTV